MESNTELKITSEMQQYINEIIEITQGDVYDSLESLILDALYVLREGREAKMKDLGEMLHKSLESEAIPLEEAMSQICEELGVDAEDNPDFSSTSAPVNLTAEAKQDLIDIIRSQIAKDDPMNVTKLVREEKSTQIEWKFLDKKDNIDSDWAQLNRESILNTAYTRLFPSERDLALHVGFVLPNNKIRIKCIVDADVANWLETQEYWDDDINDALRSFMNYRSKQSQEIQQISLDLLPHQNDPDIVYDINDSLYLIDDNEWKFVESEAHTILTLDFDLIDWYQRNYGLRYEFQIAKVIREFMESELQDNS